MQHTATTTGLDTLKARLQRTWMSGNYDYFSRYMESSAAQLLARVPAVEGTRLLDVACGSGQLALVAARRGAMATGVDIAPNLVRAARGRAQAEGLDARFDDGDAEALPYADASFDIVTSLFGAMFAPRPDRVASELARVCKPQGTIAMANWTKEGFIGELFRAIGQFVAPPGMPAPVLWGDEATVRERFGASVSELSLRRVDYRFEYPFGPADVVELFRESYGPTHQAFATLGATERDALRESLVRLWSMHNQSPSANQTSVDAQYLEVIALRA